MAQKVIETVRGTEYRMAAIGKRDFTGDYEVSTNIEMNPYTAGEGMYPRQL